jgi:hypothetical protein
MQHRRNRDGHWQGAQTGIRGVFLFARLSGWRTARVREKKTATAIRPSDIRTQSRTAGLSAFKRERRDLKPGWKRENR